MIKGKLKVIGEHYAEFYCPGCKEYHGININNGTGQHPAWGFNGNYDAPTFTPSILVKSGHYCDHAKSDDCWCHWSEKHPDEPAPFKCGICHSFVTNGKIQYLGDCTHELAGQTVDMVVPEESEEAK